MRDVERCWLWLDLNLGPVMKHIVERQISELAQQRNNRCKIYPVWQRTFTKCNKYIVYTRSTYTCRLHTAIHTTAHTQTRSFISKSYHVDLCMVISGYLCVSCSAFSTCLSACLPVRFGSNVHTCVACAKRRQVCGSS